MNSFDIKRYQRYGFGERTQTPALFFGLLATREGRDSRTPSPNLKATGSMSQLIDLSLTCTPSSMASPVKRFASKKKQKAPSLTIFNSFSMIFHPLSPQKSHHTFSSSSVFPMKPCYFWLSHWVLPGLRCHGAMPDLLLPDLGTPSSTRRPRRAVVSTLRSAVSSGALRGRRAEGLAVGGRGGGGNLEFGVHDFT